MLKTFHNHIQIKNEIHPSLLLNLELETRRYINVDNVRPVKKHVSQTYCEGFLTYKPYNQRYIIVFEPSENNVMDAFFRRVKCR